MALPYGAQFLGSAKIALLQGREVLNQICLVPIYLHLFLLMPSEVKAHGSGGGKKCQESGSSLAAGECRVARRSQGTGELAGPGAAPVTRAGSLSSASSARVLTSLSTFPAHLGSSLCLASLLWTPVCKAFLGWTCYCVVSVLWPHGLGG